MTTINKLPLLPNLLNGDLFVVWSIENGDSRRVPYSTIKDDLNNSSVPVVVTAGTYIVLATDNDIIFNAACTVTLPAPGSFPGRSLNVKTTGNTITSASSNVVPLAGGAAGTAILASVAGRWARLVSDGANWQTMSSNA